jgi:hypothetical protein
MVGATAGFHRNNAGWQLTNQRNQGVPPNTPAQNYCSGVIEADHTVRSFGGYNTTLRLPPVMVRRRLTAEPKNNKRAHILTSEGVQRQCRYDSC